MPVTNVTPMNVRSIFDAAERAAQADRADMTRKGKTFGPDSKLITEQRTIKVIDQLANGALTPAAMKEVAAQFDARKTEFGPAAQKRLQEFLKGQGGNTGMTEPTPMTPGDDDTKPADDDLDTPRYKKLTGTLFTHDPQADDIMQGAAGDCFFMSTVAALARQHPAAIKHLFEATTEEKAYNDPAVPDYFKHLLHKNAKKQDIYLVTLHIKQKHGLREIKVPVTNTELSGNATLVYARARDERETWVPLLEKAGDLCAAYEESLQKPKRGKPAPATKDPSWDAIAQGGYETRAMEMLTGKPAKEVTVSKVKPDALFKQLREALDAGSLVTAGTYSEDAYPDAKTSAQKRAPGDNKHFDAPAPDGVIPGHAYSVLDVKKTDDGKMWVKLRNPWGDTEPKEHVLHGRGEDPQNGIFWYAMDAFRKNWEDVSIGKA